MSKGEGRHRTPHSHRPSINVPKVGGSGGSGEHRGGIGCACIAIMGGGVLAAAVSWGSIEVVEAIGPSESSKEIYNTRLDGTQDVSEDINICDPNESTTNTNAAPNTFDVQTLLGDLSIGNGGVLPPQTDFTEAC